ncbi:nudix hydrolase 13, mitochondrial-like isoform X2 [Diospyros lotus]|nr:nudix hydrolase 13, mitochondrial-like isoform X2 [Diospyros lotus]
MSLCPPAPARTGRHRQRYEDQFRLVAGCIPYRFEKVVEDNICKSESRLHVLMISTPKHADLVFPKGGWENDESITEAVHREALEEAGVKGRLSEKPLGVWEFRSKSSQNSCSKGGGCRGHIYAMEVMEELESWPEQAIYGRKWLNIEDAFKSCRYDWMREALTNLQMLLSKERSKESLESPIKSARPDACFCGSKPANLLRKSFLLQVCCSGLTSPNTL